MKIKSEYLDSSVDKTALDSELLRNDESLKYWRKRITSLTMERDSIKDQIKAREAFLYLDITESPRKYKLDKSSSGLIDAKITLDSEIKNLKSDLLTVNKDLSEAYSFKDLFVERYDVIGKLITLYLNNYYAGKREERNYGKAADVSAKSGKDSAAIDIKTALQKRKTKRSS